MGLHQPPTNRSFYLSLAASTIRFAIILALVVGGVVVIDQAFQAPASSGSGGGGGGDVPGLTGGGPTTTPSPQPTAPTGATGNTAPEPSPQMDGMSGSPSSTVPARRAWQRTRCRHWWTSTATSRPRTAADAPAPYGQTTIFYRGAANKIEAEFLAEDFFAPLEIDIQKLEPGTADINQDVQLAIFLGSDYAAQAA